MFSAGMSILIVRHDHAIDRLPLVFQLCGNSGSFQSPCRFCSSVIDGLDEQSGAIFLRKLALTNMTACLSKNPLDEEKMEDLRKIGLSIVNC